MSDGYNRNNAQGPTNRPPPVKHALNDFKFRLNGQERLEGATRPPTLAFNITREGIALNAYTNVQDDDDNGRISAELSFQDAMMFFIALEQSPRMAAGSHEEIAVAAMEYNKQSNKREARPKLSMKIGRNDRGVIYLSIASWKRSRPVITIEMLPSNLIRIVDSQGNQAAADKISERYAVAWARSLSTLVPAVYNSQYIAPPPPKDRPTQGGQGGGNNGGGGSNYGGQQQQQQQQRGNQGGHGGGNNNGGNYGNDGMDDLPM